MRWLVSLRSATIVAVVLLAVGVAASAGRGGPAPVEFSGTVYLPNGKRARNATLVGTVTTYSYVEPLGESSAPLSGGDLIGQGWRGDCRLVTDAHGQYRLRLSEQKLEEVPAQARVRKTYEMLFYSPVGLGHVKVGQPFEGVAAGTRLDLHLHEGDRVAGRAVGYPGGQPLAAVEVAATIDVPGSRGHGRQAVEKAVTDQEGRFRLKASLPPEGYQFQVRPAGWALMETKTTPPPSEVPAKRTVEVRLIRPYTIRGHAYGRDGQPLRNTTLGFDTASFAARVPGLSAMGGGHGDEATTDEDGAFVLPQEPWTSPYGEGPYLPRYVALAPKVVGGMVARPVVVDATDPATQTIELHFTAPGTIVARQVDVRTGKPAVGVWTRLLPVWPNVPAEQWGVLQENVIDEARSITKDDVNGKILLRGIAPGEYRLRLGGWTIHELTAENGKAVPVTVKPGETVDAGTVQVVYVPHFGGQFAGLPWKPKPAEEGEVRAVLRPSGGSFAGGEAWVDLWSGGGKYTVWANGRGSGKYDAVLIASRDNVQYVTQVVHGLALQDDAGVEGMDVKFTRGASIRGQVVRANGRPVAGTEVSARGVGGDAVMFGAYELYGQGPMIRPGALTDSKGQFSIEGLLPGEYAVTAQVEPGVYGPVPTARVRVGATGQKRGVVLRTKGSG